MIINKLLDKLLDRLINWLTSKLNQQEIEHVLLLKKIELSKKDRE